MSRHPCGIRVLNEYVPGEQHQRGSGQRLDIPLIVIEHLRLQAGVTWKNQSYPKVDHPRLIDYSNRVSLRLLPLRQGVELAIALDLFERVGKVVIFLLRDSQLSLVDFFKGDRFPVAVLKLKEKFDSSRRF